MDQKDLKEFLDFKVQQYNKKSFIEGDPISIPHRFTQKEDIEIAGFLVATISWGNRKSILSNGNLMIDYMDSAPYDFVLHHKAKDLKKISGFVHRTFNGADFQYFVKKMFLLHMNHNVEESISDWYAQYFLFKIIITNRQFILIDEHKC